NTGLFVLYLNTLCARARVYAFEPVPAIFRVLRRNVAAHNRLDVRLFNVGLSRRAVSAAFAYYPRFSQASSMYPDTSARAARQGCGGGHEGEEATGAGRGWVRRRGVQAAVGPDPALPGLDLVYGVRAAAAGEG